jgi:predicted RNA-binding protein
MCESTVLLKEDRAISRIMPDAVTIVPVRDGLRCIDAIGRSMDLERVRLVEMDLLRHRIILERA